MSVVYEIRNNQPNHQDKCEIVVSNPCFYNRFYPIDSISLNTFSTENDAPTKKPLVQAATGKENEFMASFSQPYNKPKKANPLQVACSEGDLDAIKRLIVKENHDPMKSDPINGFFPIHSAVANNKLEAVKCLLNSFACSPNVTDKNKNTCLHFACFFGFVEIVRLLILHPDIDINCKNSDGKTCLNICEASLNPSSKICADLIKNRLKQAKWRQISVKLMDGSEISLDLISGSETNVEQLVKQICQLQLKPDQKPLQHLADWKRIIVPTLTNYDPLKEEPTLMFMRDARCTLKYEKKITNPNAVRLLCFEAYHNYIHSMYPTSDSETVILAAVFMKIVNEGFSMLQWRDFFQSDQRNLRLFVPTRKLVKISANEWIKSILIELEKINAQSSSHNQTKLQFKFLSHCWNLPIYGAAFFYANVPVQNNKFQLVHVCINGYGVHLLNTKTRLLELVYNYADIAWRIHHSPGSVEIYSKKHKLSIFLYTKQYNLINHLMLKLETQIN